jgi:multimeric flavodoxin WrbA
MTKFLFVLGSARRDGNTELLARRAAENLDAEQRWLWLEDLPLPVYRDTRHAEDKHPAPTGNEQLLLDATLDATDIVIASPLYWYTVSASTKQYLDHWTAWMYLPGVEFKPRMREKTLWGVSVLSDEREQADPLVGTLRLTADYLNMRWGGVLLGNGSRPRDVLTDAPALADAQVFFQDVYAH